MHDPAPLPAGGARTKLQQTRAIRHREQRHVVLESHAGDQHEHDAHEEGQPRPRAGAEDGQEADHGRDRSRAQSSSPGVRRS